MDWQTLFRDCEATVDAPACFYFNELLRVFDFVKGHLVPGGFYIVICAGYSPNKDYTGSIREEDTGIVYTRAGKEHQHLDDIKLINGDTYFPSRRHHTLAMLIDELESHGFTLAYSATEGDYDGLRVIVYA